MVYDVSSEWKCHFISVEKSMPQEKTLLILNRHSNHTLSVAATEIPQRHGVVLLVLTSNSMHRMQSPDVTFFRPLNTYKNISAIATRLREKPGQRLSTEYMTSLVDVAFQSAASMETAMNGFRSMECGL
jgi:hypothetical protein